jgi:hypothetical protein
VSGTIGTTPNGPVHDRGDGSYDVGVLWDPAVAPQPGVVIAQPERPPVAIMPPSVPPVAKPCGPIWLCVLLVVLLLIAVLVILLR